jgi:acyl-CoA thioesterase FadM
MAAAPDSSSLLARLAAAAAGRWRELLASAANGRWRELLAAGAGAALAAFMAAETYKSWPLSYHVRLFALLLRCRFFPQPLLGLDVPIVSRGRVRLSDLDYHGHVNNAQYALDADLAARYPWISAVLMNTGSPYKANAFIGSAAFFFVREMRWRARYRIETRCVGVDAKWIYIESHWYVEGAPARGAAARGAAAHGALGAAAGNAGTGTGAGSMPVLADASAADAKGGPTALLAPPPLLPAPAGGSPGALAAVQLTRFVLKEAHGPQRGKTIPPRDAFRELGLALPAGFERDARVGAFFSEAFEIAVSVEQGRRQSLADCGC